VNASAGGVEVNRSEREAALQRADLIARALELYALGPFGGIGLAKRREADQRERCRLQGRISSHRGDLSGGDA